MRDDIDNQAVDPTLVSIVLPTYKRAHVLPNAMRSILAQTYTHIELIIVDDNSPDNTAEIVRSFGDPRIRYVRNEPNLKLPRALNKGFSLARGGYLTWTSDDNLFAPTAVEKMVEALRVHHCDFVYADYFLFADIDAAGNALEKRHERLPGELQLKRSNHIGACFLYTRKVYEEIGDYDPELFLVEDYDYFIRIAQRFRVCHIGEPLYYFRRHDDALFCSRYCEVKAADVLVRYKNGLLDGEEAVNAVVTLILQNADGLKPPLLSVTRRLARGLSYRLTVLHRRWSERYLRRRLHENVAPLLSDYRAGKIKFGEAKERLTALMRQWGTVEYIAPPLPKTNAPNPA